LHYSISLSFSFLEKESTFRIYFTNLRSSINYTPISGPCHQQKGHDESHKETSYMTRKATNVEAPATNAIANEMEDPMEDPLLLQVNTNSLHSQVLVEIAPKGEASTLTLGGPLILQEEVVPLFTLSHDAALTALAPSLWIEPEIVFALRVDTPLMLRLPEMSPVTTIVEAPSTELPSTFPSISTVETPSD
jgi:hypothetical protein